MRYPSPIKIRIDALGCNQCGDGMCGTPAPPVAQLGDEPSPVDTSFANICRACLVQAIEALDAHAARLTTEQTA